MTYALAVAEKCEERGFDAVTLNDVDGMKKLLGTPPALMFQLLDAWCGVSTTPENDVMGNVTQLMMRFGTGQMAPYAEFYEFFENSVLCGVPDYVPRFATDGPAKLWPSAFGLLNTSFPSVSRFRDGPVTLCRLFSMDGEYKMHLFTGTASQPPAWEECGWEAPAPRLSSLEVALDCGMEAFSQKVTSQHIILTYGDQTDYVRQLCYLLDIGIVT